jgi:hypothetical protein
MQYVFKYDGKNDRFDIEYKGVGGVELVSISGSAMRYLSETENIGVKEEQDIGLAIGEYLQSQNLDSTKDNPIFILIDSDPALNTVRNSIAINSDLTNLCKKYLQE